MWGEDDLRSVEQVLAGRSARQLTLIHVEQGASQLSSANSLEQGAFVDFFKPRAMLIRTLSGFMAAKTSASIMPRVSSVSWEHTTT